MQDLKSVSIIPGLVSKMVIDSYTGLSANLRINGGTTAPMLNHGSGLLLQHLNNFWNYVGLIPDQIF